MIRPGPELANRIETRSRPLTLSRRSGKSFRFGHNNVVLCTSSARELVKELPGKIPLIGHYSLCIEVM